VPSGFLKVTFPEQRQVFVKGSPNGFTNETNQADIGNSVPVTVDGDDVDPPVRLVDIFPDETTTTAFAKKAAAPPPASPGV
jgi:hypothetical protein